MCAKRDRFPRWAFGLIVCLVLETLCLLGTSASVCLAQARAADENALRSHLRSLCQTEPKLRGIKVKQVQLADGKTTISAVVDRREQAADLEEAARNAIASRDDWKVRLTGPVVVADPEVFPLRSAYLPELQRKLAQSAPSAHEALRQVRLDDVFYDAGGRARFEGVCINQRAYIESKTDPLSAGQFLRDFLMAQNRAAKWGLSIDIEDVRFQPSPIFALQESFTGTGIDQGPEIIISSAWFDDQGALRLGGTIGQEDLRERVVAGLRVPAFRTTYGRSRATGDGLDRAAADLKVHPWRKSFQIAVAGRFASDEVLRQVWIDRITFHYNSAGKAELLLDGVSLRPVPSANDAIHAVVRAVLETQSVLWDLEPSVRIGDLKVVDGLRDAVQKAIESNPAGDGVRCDDFAFGAQGGLIVRGLWRGPAQREPLEALIQSTFRAKSGRPVKVDLPGSKITVARTDELLRHLRAWAGDRFAEVCVTRARFVKPRSGDAASPALRVEAFVNVPEKGPPPVPLAEISRVLQFWVGTHAVTKAVIAAPAWDGGKSSFELAPLTTHAPRLLTGLRAVVARDADLDGTLLVRGRYTADGSYVIDGHSDRSEQIELTRSLIDRTIRERGWADRLPAGWRLGRFVTTPTRPVIDYLNRALPAYAAFDGVALERLFFDTEGHPVLGGVATVAPDRTAAARLVDQVLKAQPALRAVLAPEGQRLELSFDLSPLEVNSATAGKNLADALGDISSGQYARAISALDTVILHQPGLSAAWYLRGGCYLQTSDPTLARRDLKRVAEIEKASSRQLRERYQTIERLPTSFRLQVSTLNSEMAGEDR